MGGESSRGLLCHDCDCVHAVSSAVHRRQGGAWRYPRVLGGCGKLSHQPRPPQSWRKSIVFVGVGEFMGA